MEILLKISDCTASSRDEEVRQHDSAVTAGLHGVNSSNIHVHNH